MNEIPGLWEYIFSLFPPDKLSLILLVSAGVFSAVQAAKVIIKGFRVYLKPASYTIMAIGFSYPMAMGIWPVKHPGAVGAVALIGWGIADIVARFGMAWLEKFAPRLHEVLNGRPDRRIDGNPKRRYKRRKSDRPRPM